MPSMNRSGAQTSALCTGHCAPSGAAPIGSTLYVSAYPTGEKIPISNNGGTDDPFGDMTVANCITVWAI